VSEMKAASRQCDRKQFLCHVNECFRTELELDSHDKNYSDIAAKGELEITAS